MKIKVFMGDLTHTTTVISSDTMPINLGFIAEYCKSKLNGKAEFVLFKYPDELIESLKSDKPDILTLSCYPWNRNLSLKIMEFYDKIHDNHINVLGGPNFPSNNIELYKKNPQLNFYIPGDGEIPFLELCLKVIDEGVSNVKKTQTPIKGVVFLRNGELISKDLFINLNNLNEIPSPYLSGILDKFFDVKLNPFIQTNRGCPFRCAFCHTGSNLHFKKVRMFELERIYKELSYIAKKVEKSSKSLIIADTNFGMYRRDLDICSQISNLRNEYGFPQHVVADFGKENRTNVMACFKELNKNSDKGAYISIAVQSTDSLVLDNVRRKHFDEKEYFEFVNTAHEQNTAVLSEVITPLPGETKESHLNTLKTLIKAKIDLVIPYTLLLLEGTELDSPDYKNKFSFQIKYRIVPRNFGTYDGIRAMETERAVVSTKDLSFSEYIEIRTFHLLLKTIFFEGAFGALINLVELHDINLEEWIIECYNQISNAHPKLRAVFDDFKKDTIDELWDSEEEMLNFFRKEENYKKLLNGDLGGNLLQKYSARLLNSEYLSMLDFLTSNLSKFSTNIDKNSSIHEVVKFLQFKNSDAFNINLLGERSSCSFSYDILEWMKHKGLPLEDFKSERMYEFFYTEEQKARIKSLIEQYGYGDDKIGKILTRESLTTFFRTVKIK